MRSLAELEFALDVIEAGRGPAPVVAAPADYVPGANPNNLSDAQLEQRRAAALKSADARRKSGVASMMQVRNMKVANAAVHKAQADFFIETAGANRKAEIRDQLRDPTLSAADRQALTDQLADVYATEQEWNAAKAQERVGRQQKLRYWEKEMADAGKRYDSAAWANAKQQADALRAEMDDEEIAGAMLKEHQGARKRYLHDQEVYRKQVAKAELERQRAVKKQQAEAERARKKREREAESARKKAEREREKAEKKAKGKKGSSDYAKSLQAETDAIKERWYGKGKVPAWQQPDYADRMKSK